MRKLGVLFTRVSHRADGGKCGGSKTLVTTASTLSPTFPIMSLAPPMKRCVSSTMATQAQTCGQPSRVR